MGAKRKWEPSSADGGGDPDAGGRIAKRRRILVISQCVGSSSEQLPVSATGEEKPDPSSPPHCSVIVPGTDLGFLQGGSSTTTTPGVSPPLDDGVAEMLGQRRLLLVLDLDHTLLHSIDGGALSPQELYLLGEAHRVEGESQRPLLFDRRSTIGYLIKLRPFIYTFLLQASTMYDVYICTLADWGYAEEMARILDPDSLYFSSDNIVSWFDYTVLGKKGLDVVYGGCKRTTIILDDKVDVWPPRHWGNLIVVPAYHYFSSSKKMLGDGWQPLSEQRRDETDAVLRTMLNILQQVHHKFFDGSRESDLLTRDVRPIVKEITKKTTIPPRILPERKN